MSLALFALGAGGCAVAHHSPSSDDERDERVGTQSSRIVGGELSSTAEDFVVYLARGDKPASVCGGTLVAPNLVLTAKHCVNHYPETSQSLCDASGEPQLGGSGGYVTGPIALADLRFYTGANGKKRFIDGEAPDAVAKKLVDDGTPTLCSHDLAYVVLDRPIASAPLGRLRLAKRPEAGPNQLALSGWGVVEGNNGTVTRMRRAGIAIQRVGPPVPAPDATGSLGPRTFETGPAGCKGDSGSPAFDQSTSAVLGVLARALNLDPSDPVSPCRPDTVSNVFMTVADFGRPLREAFADAGAEPWIEGHEAPGYARFGEACTASLECEGDLCVGATESAAGTCNVDCAKSGKACPGGTTCTANGRCEKEAPPAPATTTPPTTELPGVDPTEPEAPAVGGGCMSSRVRSHDTLHLFILTAYAAWVRGLRRRRSAEGGRRESCRRAS